MSPRKYVRKAALGADAPNAGTESASPSVPSTSDAEVVAKEAALTDLQRDASAMLDRIAAEKAAKADVPSGITVGTDYDFLKADPSDPSPYLERRGVPKRDDHAYGWLNSDSRVLGNRLAKGWAPVEGGIKRGDLLLASRPREIQEREEAQGLQRTRLMEKGPMAKFDNEAKAAGMEPFNFGNK